MRAFLCKVCTTLSQHPLFLRAEGRIPQQGIDCRCLDVVVHHVFHNGGNLWDKLFRVVPVIVCLHPAVIDRAILDEDWSDIAAGIMNLVDSSQLIFCELHAAFPASAGKQWICYQISFVIEIPPLVYPWV